MMTVRSYPKVSIINVISGNNIDFMGNCLRSLLENTEYPAVEFIIVSDAASAMNQFITDTTCRNPLVKTAFRDRQYGNAANRNHGATVADPRSDYLLFVDSDVLYTDKMWLARLIDHAKRYPDLGCIGGGDSSILGHFCWTDPDTGIVINNLMDFAGVMPDQPTEVMIIPGFSQLLPQEVFHAIGRWDEGFFPVYGEDIDLCLRCLLAGYRVFGLHNQGVRHLYRDTNANNSCERLSDDNRLWLTVAACRRLAIKYAGILPTAPQESYPEWLAALEAIRNSPTDKLQTLPCLEPTVKDNRLNLLYLPTNQKDELVQIFSTVRFNLT